ncbi:two-component system sensor histidine kinase NtrB [Halalkalibacter alkalisediminis]|uniref:histidine kinase n=1 Tax=Halalkalibacter alkalisediminis TaxID=935616 RepID=A0ABV6NC14_9BACI|nr:ATP-binding protein [Halalkalibacter alkalisediminis]
MSFNKLLVILLLSTSIFLLVHFTIILPPSGNALTLASTIYLASIFIFGLNMTLTLLFISSVLHVLINRQTIFRRKLFNFSMYAIMIIGAYSVFVLTGGTAGEIHLSQIFSYMLTIASYSGINILMIGLYFLVAGSDVFRITKESMKETLYHYLVTLGLALMLAMLIESNTILGIIVFTLLLVTITIVFRKYFYLYQESLKAQKFREQILNSLPVGIITIEKQFADLSLNTSAERLLEMNAEDLKVTVADPLKASNDELWHILSSQKICHNVKVRFTKGKDDYLLLVSQSELFDIDEKLIGTIFFFIDITNTEKLEKRIHQSEKLALLGELSAGAAHEIRNPLTVIQGFFSLIKESLSEEDRNKFQVPLIITEFSRINSIIEEMLMLAKPGAPVLKVMTFKDVLDELPYLYNKSDELKFEVNLDNHLLLIDPKQMKQVLYNLIRNSSEAMKGKGTISMYSKVDHEHFYFFFQDTGPGIPVETKESLFNPFSTSKDTGTGLGLTIAQRIIEYHNGTIELFSSSEKGTTFLITLELMKKVD